MYICPVSRRFVARIGLRRLVSFLAMTALLLVAAACGKGAEPTKVAVATVPVPTATAQSTPLPPTSTLRPSPSPEPTGTPAGNPLQDLVRRATIRIVASGSFRYPEGMRLNAAGGGSGFIIDPSGLAVTNNHVVTGAAVLKVWLQGEQEARNAKVVGVSECSDLALIQIDGTGFKALKWQEGAVDPGLDVYAAGYPLGDPEFTLTRGIISKAKADGRTDWAAVPSVIEHDATINPGNSGGPLVTKSGEVVGINYAAASQTRQSYAIARLEAEKVIQQLREGKDLDSIGINGKAFVSDDKKVSGIWIFSVRSGSPADRAGIRAGDILTQLESLVLAKDGTMSDYCGVLRSHKSTDTLSAHVVRLDSGVELDGQINGREMKEVARAPGATQASGARPAASPTVARRPATPAPSSSNFTTRRDDSGAISVDVPADWTDIDGSGWTYKGVGVGAGIIAAPSIQRWNDGWDTNGIFVGVSRQLAGVYTPESLLDERSFESDCGTPERVPYQNGDGTIKGVTETYTDCGGVGAIFRRIAALTTDKKYLLLIQLVAVSEEETNAWDRVNYRVTFDRVPGGQPPPAPTARPAAPTAQPAAQSIAVTVQKANYEQWGRPECMDDATKNCGKFNNLKPVRKLTVSLRIQNRSNQAMTNWWGYFYKPDGKQATTAYQGYDQGFPSIPAGKSLDITFSVYVETNESVSYGVISDKVVGSSPRITLP